ncbi:MAG: hypothetical protein JWR45_2130 [Blastococcus sp.]|jgi:hypothetical protein|nr:hypothetical protein [Blastococcus sp.]
MTSPDPGTAGPQHDGAPRARASDAEREAVVRILHDALTRGLLTLEEGDARVTAAYAARFVDELPGLTADLPPAPMAAPGAPGWRALLLLAWLQLRTLLSRDFWRGAGRAVRSRPRVAVAAVALLVLLSVGAAMAGEGFDHGDEGGPGQHELERG